MTPNATELYYWLVAPTAQGGRGSTALAAALWLDRWDGATVPPKFDAWQQRQQRQHRGTLAP